MVIAVKLSESQFRHFIIFNILKRLKSYKSPVIFASILTFSAIICFLMYKVDGAILLGFVLLVVGLGMPIVYFATFFTSLRKQVKLQKLDPPRLVYTLQFEEDSDVLNISNDKEKVSYRWQEVFHAYYETDSIYLFITKDRAFLLPLASLGDSNAVWKLIETKLGSERCTKKK
ncbi:MAG: YcxB family protein [Sphaerochaetaceae bacterium]